jgi:hypothetical protein
MLSLLVVSPPDPELARLAKGHPSVEILTAHDVDEALEKLGRNRRIDAVLIARWPSAAASDLVAEIREDNPAPPPLFLALGNDAGIRGVRPLGEVSWENALDRIERELSAAG